MLLFQLARAQLMMGTPTDALGDLPPGTWVHVTLQAGIAYADGDWPACRAAARSLLDHALRRGNRWLEFVATHQLARLALAEGDTVEAEDSLVRSLEFVAGQHRPSEALVCSDLAVLYADMGRADEARTVLPTVPLSLPTSEDWCGLRGRLALADAAFAAAEGRSDVAYAHFKQAVAVFRRYRLPWDEAQAHECWGTALIRTADRAAAKRRFDVASAIYRRHGAGRRWVDRLSVIRAGARLGHPAGSACAAGGAVAQRSGGSAPGGGRTQQPGDRRQSGAERKYRRAASQSRVQQARSEWKTSTRCGCRIRHSERPSCDSRGVTVGQFSASCAAKNRGYQGWQAARG